MANPQIQQNQIPNTPQLKDLLDLHKKDIFLSMSVHHIGTIQSFDPATQTASATVNYKKTFFELDTKTGLYNPVLLDYPILTDCPVIVLGGGSAALTFPIAQGDECLCLFNDRDIDNWFAGAGNGAVASSRLHSFSDGLILVGIRSLNNVLSGYDTARAVLRNGDALVGVGPSHVKISNNSTNLKTVLDNLISAIEAATYGGSGIDSTAALEAVRTLVGGLLE